MHVGKDYIVGSYDVSPPLLSCNGLIFPFEAILSDWVFKDLRTLDVCFGDQLAGSSHEPMHRGGHMFSSWLFGRNFGSLFEVLSLQKNTLPWWYVFVTVGHVFCHACTSMTNLWQNQDGHTCAVVEVFHVITKIIITEVSTSMTINRASHKCFRQGWPTRAIHHNETCKFLIGRTKHISSR